MYEKNTYYKWIIVGLAILTVFFSGPGQTYFISGFTESFIESFGLSRTAISSYYSGATLTAGLLLMVIGKFIDVWGHRKITMLIGACLGLVCILMGNISVGLLLIPVFFLLRLLGQGSMVLLPSTLVPNWFTKKRAFALSLVTLGGVIGSVVIPPFNTWLLTILPWQQVWWIWGGLLLFVFVPVIYFLLYNLPYNEGQKSVEEAIGQEKKEAVNNTKEADEEESSQEWTLKEAISTGGFWRVVYAQSMPALINTGLYFHLTSIMASKDLDAGVAAMTLSVIGMCSFPATFLAGFVLERVKVHLIYGISFVIQVLAVFVLMQGKATSTALIFAVLIGIITGFQNVSRRFIWPEYYGRKHLSTISGLTMTTLVMGSAVGPIIIGAGFDLYGNYQMVMWIMMGLSLLAAICAFLSPKPIKKSTKS